jgi:hypothetical protein
MLLVPIHSQINLVLKLPFNFLIITFNIIIPSTSWSSEWSLICMFYYQNPANICLTPLSPPAHLILPHLVTRIIFGEECKSRSSLLRTFLQCPVILSHWRSDILLSTLLARNSLSRFADVCHGIQLCGNVMSCQRASHALYVHWVWEAAVLQMNSNMTQERTTWQELHPSDLGHNPENRGRSHGNLH